jgi:acetyltransferase-like isoleucine patch superfamily enzyme
MLARAVRHALALLRQARDPIGYHRSRGVRIGSGCELIGTTLHTFGSEPYLVTIGDGVTVSHGADFLTHDGGLRVVRDRHPGAFYYAPITVGDHAFIGAHAVLLPGTVIGERAVVGAGAVVSGEVPAGTVVAGVPARPVKSVEEYGSARRAEWIDTAGLSARDKERLLRRRFAR